MKGLEKITERILQDAKTECDEKISTAKEDVNQIKSKYRTEAEKMLCEAQESVQKEVDARRNALLEAKSAMVDEAYEKAVRFIARMDDAAYYALLLSMLKKAVIESEQADSTLLADEQSEYVKPESFVVSMNAKDYEKYAIRLQNELTVKNLSAVIRMAEEPIDIAGGMMIQYGNVSMDCSIEKSVQLVRSQTETEVFSILFGIQAGRREQSEA